MSFELRYLEGFVAVAEELHFGRAAARLHLAQPALSQQVKKLEETLGVNLLIRDHRRTRLSDAGKAFLVEARRTLAHADRARTVARRAGRGELGRLRVGYVPTTSSKLFLTILAAFQRRYPSVELDVRELALGLLASPLHDDLVDVAFIARLGKITCLGADTAFRELSAEHFVAAVPTSHPMASRPTIELSELAEESFVLLTAKSARSGMTPYSTSAASPGSPHGSRTTLARCPLSSCPSPPGWGWPWCPPRQGCSAGMMSPSYR